MTGLPGVWLNLAAERSTDQEAQLYGSYNGAMVVALTENRAAARADVRLCHRL